MSVESFMYAFLREFIPGAEPFDAYSETTSLPVLWCGRKVERLPDRAPPLELNIQEAPVVKEGFYDELLEAFLSSGHFEVIGQGAIATVYKFEYDGRVYAIKVYDKTVQSKEEKESREHRFLREGTIGPMFLAHPSIVNVLFCKKREDVHYLIMDFVRGDDLATVIKQDISLEEHGKKCYQIIASQLDKDALWVQKSLKNSYRRWENIRRIMKQLVSALAEIHCQGCIYRDVKAENIRVVVTNGVVKNIVLVDLGFIRHTYTKDGLPVERHSIKGFGFKFSFCGTCETIAPEVLLNSHYSTKADCWSLGALLYYLCVGKYPFEGETRENTKTNTLMMSYKMPHWIPLQAKDLIKKLLVKDHEKRLSIVQVEAHPFFTMENIYFSQRDELPDDLSSLREDILN